MFLFFNLAIPVLVAMATPFHRGCAGDWRTPIPWEQPHRNIVFLHVANEENIAGQLIYIGSPYDPSMGLDLAVRVGQFTSNSRAAPVGP